MDDAFYSLNLEPVRRSDGRDSVAAVAYILGARIRNDARPHGYSNFSQQRDRVIATGRALPAAVPDWAQDIGTVWNRNEKVNNRSNSQLGQRIIVALPHEIKPAKRVEVVAEFAAYLVQSYGVLVEYALHMDEGDNNPHAHLIFTDRMITFEGFGAKVREFAKKKFYYEIRDKWAELGNAALAASGASKRLSSKSYKARGIEKMPTQHRGIGARMSDASQVIETQQEREDSMGHKPDRMERFNYPNIAHLDFPPRVEDAENALQRGEVERYYVDRKESVPVAESQDEREIWDGRLPSVADASEREQRDYQKYLDEQATERSKGSPFLRSLPSQHNRVPPKNPEYALSQTFEDLDVVSRDAYQEIETRPDRAHLEVMRSRQAEREYEDLRSRARDLHIAMTPQEKRIMEQVKDAPRDVQDYYKERIVLARMRELQIRDFEHRRRELDKVILRTNRTHEQRERAETFKEADRELKDLPRSCDETREVDMVQDDLREVKIAQDHWDMKHNPENYPEREHEYLERKR